MMVKKREATKPMTVNLYVTNQPKHIKEIVLQTEPVVLKNGSRKLNPPVDDRNHQDLRQ